MALLRKLAATKISNKKRHMKMQMDYSQTLVALGLDLDQIFNDSTLLCESLDKLFFNSYTGISSNFLKE